MRRRVAPGEQPQSRVAEQLDGGVERSVAGDLEFDQLITILVMTLGKVNRSPTVCGSTDQAGCHRNLVGPVYSPGGDACCCQTPLKHYLRTAVCRTDLRLKSPTPVLA